MAHLDTPEKRAREQIDAALLAAGWHVQSRDQVNLHAGRGVAVREFQLKPGHGYADYLLCVDGQAAGVVEAKKEGSTLTGVEVQAEKYAAGVPDALPVRFRPLPFLYQSTGVETRFTNRFDPDPRSRAVFHFHKPETLADWLEADALWLPMIDNQPDPRSSLPSTLRSRVRAMPSLEPTGLWPAQFTAVRNLEADFVFQRRGAELAAWRQMTGELEKAHAGGLVDMATLEHLLSTIDASPQNDGADATRQNARTNLSLAIAAVRAGETSAAPKLDGLLDTAVRNLAAAQAHAR